jgi:hypothetical protein
MELLDRCRLWLGRARSAVGGGDVSSHRVVQIGNLNQLDDEIRMLMRL